MTHPVLRAGPEQVFRLGPLGAALFGAVFGTVLGTVFGAVFGIVFGAVFGTVFGGVFGAVSAACYDVSIDKIQITFLTHRLHSDSYQSG